MEMSRNLCVPLRIISSFSNSLLARRLARLRRQPREHLKIASGTITSESYKVLKEQETQFRVFKFYSVINIYDARLKKNILIPITQTWDFANYPDARFGFKIEIDSDGSPRWKTS